VITDGFILEGHDHDGQNRFVAVVFEVVVLDFWVVSGKASFGLGTALEAVENSEERFLVLEGN